MAVALADDEHVVAQKALYRARREALLPALREAGCAVDHSEAGLYLWATRGEDCRTTLTWLAERGILVAPGDFYGAAAQQHVRFALTATDERVDAAVTRLARAQERELRSWLYAGPQGSQSTLAAAVTEVSRRLLAGGTRPCLITDLANPIPNRLYASLGFRAVADLANLVRVAPGLSGA